MQIIRFLKEWTLPVSMLSGVLMYLLFDFSPLTPVTKESILDVVKVIQPLLIFLMLFLTFCKVEVRDMHLRRWHIPLLTIQGLSFIALCLLILFDTSIPLRPLIEGLMLCLICPTATAAAVVTRKLGGSAANITTYTIYINILVSVLIPIFVPMLHPHAEHGFFTSAILILTRVFPLLLLPMLFAWMVKKYLPTLHYFCCKYPDLSFYLWGIALSLAIAVTTHTLVLSGISFTMQLGFAIVSLGACLCQFYIGRKIGARSDDTISAGQALGQKNTVLAIWMGYTFFDPVTSLAAGFYMIWHNVVNTYQLYRHQTENRIPS